MTTKDQNPAISTSHFLQYQARPPEAAEGTLAVILVCLGAEEVGNGARRADASNLALGESKMPPNMLRCVESEPSIRLAHPRGVIVAFFLRIESKLEASLALQSRLLGLLFIPESPRYLLVKGRIEEASKSRETLRGNSVPAEYGIEEEKRDATTVGALNMFTGILFVAFSLLTTLKTPGTELR
ncbi:uncharacterized protein BDR25DRAFT_359638 [Lindgomyces ingoldianus]|uniref:Uncharacterized protein n=1 Tax=Lindgomyces ingoldianus TaxID=673940 RepID=A0ACB6QIX5_9PLEO|nr:uncharacterized protein BDR25DRAFT_359638 [Lindgomyces ingoldianus]KAF2466272.1 hypothetical protein BDR25DRAFT_359638 [Lindgomyces ingoldianus]